MTSAGFPRLQSVGGSFELRGGCAVLIRVASWCYDNRRRTIALWVVAFAGVFFLSSRFGGEFHAEYSAPGAESTRAFELLESRFPSRAGDTVDVVVEAPAGVATPDIQRRLDEFLAAASKVEGVVGTVSPTDRENGGQISEDGTIGFGSLQLNVTSDVYGLENAKKLTDLAAKADAEGFRLELGG